MPSLLTILSAALVVLSFPTWNLTHLIWISLVPWLIAVEKTNTTKQAFIQGLWMSILVSLGGFYWVAYVLKEFGGLPWAVSIAGLLLFALICQPQFTIYAPLILSKKPKRYPLLYALGVSLAYPAIDWGLPKLFQDTLGHSFYNSPIFRQGADLVGPIGLTFLIVFVNHTLWRIYSEIRRRQGPSLWPALDRVKTQAVLSLALVIGAYIYGSSRLAHVRQLTEATPRHVQAAVIQANIGDFDKIAAERGVRGAANKVLETFWRLSDQALQMTPKPDFLVWPETSYPSTFRNPQTPEELGRDQQMESYTQSRGTPIYFGGYDHLGNKDYNALFFLTPSGGAENQLQIYRKNILLAFGEYIPFTENIKWVRDLFPQVGYFGRGVGPEVIEAKLKNPDVPVLKVSPIICYEALFPNYVIAAARKGSQLILNITNDSWFGPYGEPELHLALISFRGIETRLPQLRSTNTGISTLITADGEITHPTRVDQAEIMSVSVPLTEPIPTLLKAWGDWFGYFSILASLAILVAYLRHLPRS